MRSKILLATLLAGGAAALIPSAASAQTSFGFSISSGYPRYYPPLYYDDEARERWEARRRWEAHERWEARERWEREEARRRYVQREYWEHRRWHEDDDDDDGD